ncbi:MAG TPA: glutamine-hydrolyzing carbamoyl-phosphate synthase small subunit [Anaerolineae bacterium]|nr:glutamine-hydrolyzing carbamoyl-phosphate synthase small subunit [Anaerolineae bacterium]
MSVKDLAYLALADGTVFPGRPLGAPSRRSGEVVFNTSMTGYQEILTDPSYCRQIVIMTAPQIGNTGLNDEDDESERIWAAGFVVRRASLSVSSWRATGSLHDGLAAQNIVGITDVDTRSLVRHLREGGAQHGAIVSDGGSAEDALALARSAPDINRMDLVGEVSCAAPYAWTAAADAAWYPGVALPAVSGAAGPHVVVYDFGVKRNTLRLLVSRGCRVTVVPARTTAEAALALGPDGVLLSNGPGDPATLGDIVTEIGRLLGRVPVFGICLGHQLLGTALGGRTYKLKFGHRGGNQPVKGPEPHVAISSQNHGYALDGADLAPDVAVTHLSLNDGSVEGIRSESRRCFSVQYHPEAAPGPHDAAGLFDTFVAAVVGGAASVP